MKKKSNQIKRGEKRKKKTKTRKKASRRTKRKEEISPYRKEETAIPKGKSAVREVREKYRWEEVGQKVIKDGVGIKRERVKDCKKSLSVNAIPIIGKRHNKRRTRIGICQPLSYSLSPVFSLYFRQIGECIG